MKIGFVVPSTYSVGNPGNGILAQARYQADALEKLGHEVVKLNPWNVADLEDYDVVQYFQGGLNLFGIEECQRRLARGILVFAPIIDSNESNFKYGLAAKLGNILPKLYTVPSVYQMQASTADLVIVRSEHERQRVVKGLSITARKVEIVLNGANHADVDDTDQDLLKKKYGLPNEYMLHVSAYSYNRKNVLRLVEVADELGYPLLIAGRAYEGEVLKGIRKIAENSQNIRLLNYVDEDTLHALYSCCKVFCLPSIHEGTGLVALEAAVRGANVVITKNGGPPDYFGDFAEYVDPYNKSDIRRAVEAAWKKPRNLELKEHVVQNLSWDNSARQLVAAYTKHMAIKMGSAGGL